MPLQPFGPPCTFCPKSGIPEGSGGKIGTQFQSLFGPNASNGMLAEFRTQTGTALSQIQNETQLASEETAWAYVLAHPDFDDYGLLGISMAFRLAVGMGGARRQGRHCAGINPFRRPNH
ncbi:hypothetical protein GCM10027594_14330 [Hymenobacter agri]